MARIEGKNLTVRYDGPDILNGLDIAIPENKITSIIGPNGCGKSTLLKALARLLPMQSGTVLLDGKDIGLLSGIQIARKMAILPQGAIAPPGLTVEELVAYGRYPHQKGFGHLTESDREKIAWSLRITNLSEFAQRDVDALSGGQRQRVWIAMALAQDTDLILLDEPTTYLDLVHQLEVLQLLQELNEQAGRTIALVIHELNMASRVSDHIIAMKSGQIVAQGPPESIMTPDTLREVFGIDAVIVPDPNHGKPVCVTYEINKSIL